MVAPEFTTMDSRVFRPSETIMFADCAMPKEGGIIVEYGFAEPPHFVTSDHPTGNLEWGLATPAHFRHNGRVNVVRCDGHFQRRVRVDRRQHLRRQQRATRHRLFGPENNYYLIAATRKATPKPTERKCVARTGTWPP